MTTPRRESHWFVMRRCLAIIRRLQRGAASRRELIDISCAQDDVCREATEASLDKRLHKDLTRIRKHIGVAIQYDRSSHLYTLGALEDMALLDLPDAALDVMAFLSETFDAEAPQHDKVRLLLDTLKGFLSEARRRDLARRRSSLQVDLKRKDADMIDPEVRRALERACIERRRVEFLYRSPTQKDGQPRRHEVEPYELTFDTVRRHYYLRGFCLYTDGPRGRRDQSCFMHYRLGRIVTGSVTVLPQKMPPMPRRVPKYPVRYTLSPEIARFGVTHYFDDMVVESRDDGSALVHGYTYDVFSATRTLLHYGPGCRVLGGSEMLREMQRLVENMAKVYELIEIS